MKHRHLLDRAGFSPAAIHDILERGGPADWIALRDAVRAEPGGVVAKTVLDVCEADHMYGTSSLWKAFVSSLRRSAR